MKPGTIFEHRHWLDVSNRPLLCVVTAVRAGVVYWAIWPNPPGRRGRYWFDLADAGRYVGCVIQEGDHPGRPVMAEESAGG